MAGELQGIGYMIQDFRFVVSPEFQHWGPNMPRYWAYKVEKGKAVPAGSAHSYTRAVKELRR